MNDPRFRLFACALLILSAMLLTGCATCAPCAATLPAPPPLLCPPDPEPPAGDTMTAQAAGIYIARLWEAGQACREAAEGLQVWAVSLAHPGETPENVGHD